MSPTELSDRIHCWLWLYEHSPFPLATDPIIQRFNTAMARHWIEEMVIDIRDLEIPPELIGSQAEMDLCTAKRYAQNSELNHVTKIRDLLLRVQTSLVKSPIISLSDN